MNNLPELPQPFLKLIKREEDEQDAINDPLMANTSRANDDDETDDWNQRGRIDPVLSDHSDSQHQILGEIVVKTQVRLILKMLHILKSILKISGMSLNH